MNKIVGREGNQDEEPIKGNRVMHIDYVDNGALVVGGQRSGLVYS
jgi:hypothetical protein